MQIKNVNQADLAQTLILLNKKYDDNVTFNNFQRVGAQFRVTLRVRDSHKKGAKLGFRGRHTINACWHVHGDFFDILLRVQPKAVIKTAGRTVDINGGNWEDWNIGSIMEPLYYSEACECGL